MPNEQIHLLIAEDEALIGLMLRDLFEASGYVCTVTGTVAATQEAAQAPQLDAAILDIKLQGEIIFPVAQSLRARGVPYVFTSGYARARLPSDFEGALLFEKPFSNHALLKAIGDIIDAKR